MGLSRAQLGHAVSLAITPHVPRGRRAWENCRCGRDARPPMRPGTGSSRRAREPRDDWTAESDRRARRRLRAGCAILRCFRLSWTCPHGRLGLSSSRSRRSFDRCVRRRRRSTRLACGAVVPLMPSNASTWSRTRYLQRDRQRARQVGPAHPRNRRSQPSVSAGGGARGRGRGPRIVRGVPASSIRALRPLMNRIHISERAEFHAALPAELMCRITVQLRTGERVVEQIAHPRGHVRNPLTDEEIDRKSDSPREPARRPRRSPVPRGTAGLVEFRRGGRVSEALKPLGSLRAT